MSNEQPSKMWSGRFREPLNKTFEEWQRSFPFDWRLLPQEVAASKAHARVIAAAGILTDAELATMLDGLDKVLAQTTLTPAVVASAPEAEDIHHFTELQLTRIIGDLALKLHTGRSRNEQIVTDMRLFVRDAIDATLAGLREWRKALIDLAENAGEAVMPSYTHLQRAEPVLVAHWLLTYVSQLERDSSRLVDARKRMNLCPLGSGAIAGATLALDRTIAAKALGFDGPTPNSMDATSDRDFALEFTQALTTLGIHISRFAEELTLYSTAEFGFLDLPEAFSTGSSAMPQKKNPDLTELIRGKSGRLLGAATTLATLIKGLPLAYNKDLQEGQEPVFDAADTIAGMLSVLPAFTASLKFRFDRMKLAAETGYLNAMAAATYLSNKGVPFRKAHEIIGNAVRLGLETGRELDQLTLEELRQLGPEFDQDFYASITLEATLDCHDVVGGTARHRVRQALADARKRLEAESGKV
ncbi:argininosuccinate lyase [Edaphobacter dinghuensis]|uniref:Argininosuccinate lyase n=1 Tax=Edaphobacter dinghuensis TaxID=1560005 RepID=A0A917HE11_9BACT|nr:argininosuccinate lyase [Edaphobacter dinghuensis]GGG76239.1 argininosuccinate lyase [Edaphobacter dinghuensis]